MGLRPPLGGRRAFASVGRGLRPALGREGLACGGREASLRSGAEPLWGPTNVLSGRPFSRRGGAPSHRSRASGSAPRLPPSLGRAAPPPRQARAAVPSPLPAREPGCLPLARGAAVLWASPELGGRLSGRGGGREVSLAPKPGLRGGGRMCGSGCGEHICSPSPAALDGPARGLGQAGPVSCASRVLLRLPAWGWPGACAACAPLRVASAWAVRLGALGGVFCSSARGWGEAAVRAASRAACLGRSSWRGGASTCRACPRRVRCGFGVGAPPLGRGTPGCRGRLSG